MIEKILVATDGSDHAEKAVAMAGEIAASQGAKLKLLYVNPPGSLSEARRRRMDRSDGGSRSCGK